MINFSIHRKLILSYLFFAVLPTIALGVYLSSNIRMITVTKAIVDAERNVDRIQAEFSRSFNNAIDLSRQISQNKNFLQSIEKEYTSSWEVVETYLSFADFENLRKIYKNSIDNIRIYVDNKTILEGWYLYKINAHTVNQPWYTAAYQNPNKLIWGPTTDPNAFSKNYQCYTLVYYTENNGRPLAMLIDINTDYINSILNEHFFDTVIFDENNHILCASVGAEAYALRYSFETYAYNTQFVEMNARDDNGRNKKIIMKDMVIEGINGRFRIVSSFWLDDLSRESDNLFLRCLFITVACILLMITLIFYFSHDLRKRVAVLSHEMELVSKGNFNLVIQHPYKDEIGILSQNLSVMAENLKKLEQENYEANLQKQNLLLKHRDIKLRMLANQMNPHFLFNTLESLRMEAHIRNEKDISDVIERLGRLLRKSIQADSEESTLADELKLVQDYLYIQTYRYKDRIQCAFSVCAQAEAIKILPLILQPIVENAIIHGLENSEKNGMINVNVYLEEDLFIEVMDNGLGMSPERLEQLRASLHEEAVEDHIGMHNVHTRLQLRYGAPYGLTIDSEQNAYTKVTIRVPAIV